MDILTTTFLLAGLGATGAPALQSVLDEMRASQAVPGVSAVVVRQNKILFAGASGVADLETAKALTADSVFYAGSLSKLLTASLVLQLVEHKALSLDDAVPGIGDDSQTVTVAHLLTHSSGLQREGNFGYWFSADFPDETSLADYLASTELRGTPGQSLHYSNIGYAALGPVVERATEQSFADALQARVLEPLNMTASGARGPAPGVTNGYTPPGRIIPSPDRPFAGVGRKVGSRHVRMYHDARAMSPAFGAYTSANDLGRLARFLLGNGSDEVLSKSMRKRMREKQASGWGLGIRVETLDGRTTARHGGWFAAHRSHFLLDIDNGVGVVVMTNGDNADPESIADALLETTLRAERKRIDQSSDSSSTESTDLRISAAQ